MTPLPLPSEAVALTRLPLTRATQLPGAAFLDPDVLAWEREHVFGAEWICAGHVDRLSEPGTFFTVEVGGESVLVIADSDGLPRAFANVCRHRGARIVSEQEGQVERLRCPYHSWTYDLDGSLRNAAFTDGLEDFAACDYGLHPVRLAVIEGLILLDLSGEALPPEAHIGDLGAVLARYRTPDLCRAARRDYAVAANWKVIAENYNECMHCPGVHPELSKLSNFRSGVQLEGTGAWCGGSMDLRAGAETMARQGGAHRPPIAGLTEDQTRQIWYFSLFPNLLVSMHPDYVMLHTLWPRSVDRTEVVCEWFFEPSTVAAAGFDPSDAVDFWDQVNREDWAMCERAQLGMSSRSYVPGRYTTLETDVHRFDTMIADRYLRALVPDDRSF